MVNKSIDHVVAFDLCRQSRAAQPARFMALNTTRTGGDSET